MQPLLTPGELVRRYQLQAKKRFGQHFLVDPTILGAVAGVADIGAGDRVLEIGPGPGTLTVTMLGLGARVCAVELDRDLAAFLRRELVPEHELTLIEGDILAQDLRAILSDEAIGGAADATGARAWKCAANLPYNVATEVFFRLADVVDRFSLLALMFQREVAQRFVADVGDSDYGVLSLMSRLYTDAEIAMTLPPGAFRPPPRVHSAVVRFAPVAGTRIVDPVLRDDFRKLVRHAFQTRRKTLPNALVSTGVSKERLREAIDAVRLEQSVRPERVHFDQFVQLAALLRDDLAAPSPPAL